MKALLVVDIEDYDIDELTINYKIKQDESTIISSTNARLTKVPDYRGEDFFEYWRKKGFNECLGLILGDDLD